MQNKSDSLIFFPFRCSKWVQPNKPKTQLRFKPSVFLLSAPTITRLPLRRLGAGERLSPPRGFPLTSLDLCRQAGVSVGAGKRGAEGVTGGGSCLDVGQDGNSSGLRRGWAVSGSPGEPKHLSQSGSDGSSGSITSILLDVYGTAVFKQATCHRRLAAVSEKHKTKMSEKLLDRLSENQPGRGRSGLKGLCSVAHQGPDSRRVLRAL